MENNTVRPYRIFFPGCSLRLTANDIPGDKFLLLYTTNKKGLVLTLNDDRLLFSESGIGFAVEDETMMVDLTDRPGVGVFSLSVNHWSQRAAKVHDFETSCRAYQLTHTRSESEAHFDSLLEQLSCSMLEEIQEEALSFLSWLFSWKFWDIKKTRWK